MSQASAPASPTPSLSPASRPGHDLLEALLAPGPLAGEGDSSNLYGELIGTWDAEVVDHLPDGTDRRQSAEVHFAWILEGRAVQDLWIAPARRERPSPSPWGTDGNRYGTTLRIYDPRIDAWRITWCNPVNGVECRLVGRRVGARIVHAGSDPSGRLIRWTFEEIRPDAFHWRGEHSVDGGRTWSCDSEFLARRRVASVPLIGEANEVATGEAISERRVTWSWTDRPGLEALHVVRDASGVRAEGHVLVVLDGSPASVRYRIEHDAGWRFRRARIELGLPETARGLDIASDGRGRWTIQGEPRPDLEGCEDLDLMVTPYTNTPPLASHPLAPGRSRELRVAWVRFPDLDTRAVEQEYTRLDAQVSADRHARYRYRNLASGFTGDLSVDGDGLVLDYGPWTRS